MCFILQSSVSQCNDWLRVDPHLQCRNQYESFVLMNETHSAKHDRQVKHKTKVLLAQLQHVPQLISIQHLIKRSQLWFSGLESTKGTVVNLAEFGANVSLLNSLIDASSYEAQEELYFTESDVNEEGYHGGTTTNKQFSIALLS